MADRYVIHVPAAIEAKVATWGLPPALVDGMWARLRNDLATDPHAKLRRVLAPWGQQLNLFTFSLPAGADPQTQHTFMFHLVYTADETGLIVVECGYQSRRVIG